MKKFHSFGLNNSIKIRIFIFLMVFAQNTWFYDVFVIAKLYKPFNQSVLIFIIFIIFKRSYFTNFSNIKFSLIRVIFREFF